MGRLSWTLRCGRRPRRSARARELRRKVILSGVRANSAPGWSPAGCSSCLSSVMNDLVSLAAAPRSPTRTSYHTSFRRGRIDARSPVTRPLICIQLTDQFTATWATRAVADRKSSGELVVDLVSDDKIAYAEHLGGLRLRLLTKVTPKHLAQSVCRSQKLGCKRSFELVGVPGATRQK